jgi:hypothetical protein
MQATSPLDIRIAVLVHPLVIKEDQLYPAQLGARGICYTRSQTWNLNRIKVPGFNNCKLFNIRNMESTVFTDIAPPRQLLVPQLPHPSFQTVKPPRFFWHSADISPNDPYVPSCLMLEAQEEMPVPVYNSASICAYARYKLPKKGILRQDRKGFVYLELPDNFITEIFPLLNDQESEAIPLYYLEPSPAHIPIILPQEWAQIKGWGELKRVENSFAFEITHLFSLKPKRWPGIERVYFFEIKSSELEDFRERHLLPSRIHGHAFHVVIAFKKAAKKSTDPPKEVFRLNVSCFAA